MQDFTYTVIVNGRIVASGTEHFSSRGNAVLMLRSRHQHALPKGLERCWQMIDVNLK